MPRNYYVYILANRSKTLYVGVTNDLHKRVLEHRANRPGSFTKRYAVYRLVHVEVANRPRDAITREKEIKRWSRDKKIGLIEASNPEWVDLAEDWC